MVVVTEYGVCYRQTVLSVTGLYGRGGRGERGGSGCGGGWSQHIRPAEAERRPLCPSAFAALTLPVRDIEDVCVVAASPSSPSDKSRGPENTLTT